MTMNTEWMPTSVETPAAAIDSPHLFGIWTQLAAKCWKRRSGGRIENAREALNQSEPKQSFLISWGIAEVWIPWLLNDCEFWRWENDSLVLQNYPADEERKLVEKKKLAQEYGRKGASKRWSDKDKERTSKVDRKREAESTAQPKAKSDPHARGVGFNDALGAVAASLEQPTPATEEEKVSWIAEMKEMVSLDKPPL